MSDPPATTQTAGSQIASGSMSDLAAAIAQYQAMSGSTADQQTFTSIWSNTLDDDYVIQQDRKKVPFRASTQASQAYLPGGSTASQGRDFQAATMDRLVEQRVPRTAKSMLTDFVQTQLKKPDEYLTLQQQLFMGGFFTPNAKLDDIQFGALDDLTLDAYQNLLTWTARYNEGGADLTAADVLKQRAAQMLGPLREKLNSSGSARTVSLADPAGLAQALDQVATQTVGRKSTADEQRMFVAMFHAMQAGSQPQGSGGTVITPDVQGQAEQMMRNQAPVEAGAHDLANTFNDFMSIIGGMGTN
jgi:hypothetical protein